MSPFWCWGGTFSNMHSVYELSVDFGFALDSCHSRIGCTIFEKRALQMRFRRLQELQKTAKMWRISQIWQYLTEKTLCEFWVFNTFAPSLCTGIACLFQHENWKGWLQYGQRITEWGGMIKHEVPVKEIQRKWKLSTKSVFQGFWLQLSERLCRHNPGIDPPNHTRIPLISITAGHSTVAMTMAFRVIAIAIQTATVFQ